MHDTDLTWLIGGPQGGGTDTAAQGFARAAVRMGLRVVANSERHSNIMGEHSYWRVRLSSEDRNSLLDRVNVLVALDDDTLIGDPHDEFGTFKGHLVELVSGGVAIYDTGGRFKPAQAGRNDITLVGMPYMELLRQALGQLGRESDANRLRAMVNTVAVGGSVFALGGDLDGYVEGIRAEFTGRRADLADMNVRAAQVGYEFAARQLGRGPFNLQTLASQAQANHPDSKPLFMRGMNACAIGKLKAGLQLQTYYPISPATDENVYLEGQQRDFDLLVVQCEDEIAAIQMAVGAAGGGARASTSTSGPGFALMVEGIGYAAMTETPGPVIMLWQRGGPSTGLPTRQDQSDLRFVLHPAQGDFPHIVVAPADHQQIFDDAFESFNWADRYQVPVVVMLDKFQADLFRTIDEIKQDNLVIDRGARFHASGHANSDGADYLRFAFTETGVSPRSFPGEAGGVFWSTSDEHNPRGHITEDAENRIRMMEKRMGKLDQAAREIPPERKISVYGPRDADLTLVGYGSVTGTVLDAMQALAEQGGPTVNFVQVRLMRPFPVQEVTEALAGARRLALVEGSYSGNLAGLIREHTGVRIPQKLLKYDGRPFSEEELVEAIRQAFAGSEARIHVSHRSA